MKINHVLLSQINKSLPELEKQLQKDIGYSIKLIVFEVYDRNNIPHITIESKPINPKYFGIFNTIMKSANINSFGYLGEFEDRLIFAPHLLYTHQSFGTNGHDIFKNGKKLQYCYMHKTKKWIENC